MENRRNFQIFCIFTLIWGRFPFWLIFFKRVEPPTSYGWVDEPHNLGDERMAWDEFLFYGQNPPYRPPDWWAQALLSQGDVYIQPCYKKLKKPTFLQILKTCGHQTNWEKKRPLAQKLTKSITIMRCLAQNLNTTNFPACSKLLEFSPWFHVAFFWLRDFCKITGLFALKQIHLVKKLSRKL